MEKLDLNTLHDKVLELERKVSSVEKEVEKNTLKFWLSIRYLILFIVLSFFGNFLLHIFLLME